MVVERAEFIHLADRIELFLQALKELKRAVEADPGCRSFEFGVGVENPGKIILLVCWDSVEAHIEARKNPAVSEIGGRILPMLAQPHAAEHFNMQK